MKEISINDMLKAGVHFGHQTSRWNPKMAPFIFGQKEGVHIIDLQKTQKELEKALNFVSDIASSGKKIVFIGTRRHAKKIIKDAAISCKMPYVVERWPGGTFTNYDTVKKQIEKLIDLREKEKSGEFEKYTKKEQLLFKDEIERLEKLFGGMVSMKELPGAIFVLNTVHDFTPIREAKKMNIPVVALVDTNSDPDTVDYPIASNDDAIKSIELMSKAVADAISASFKDEVLKTEDESKKLKKLKK
jgi:small subunit ribosomal protein S2